MLRFRVEGFLFVVLLLSKTQARHTTRPAIFDPGLNPPAINPILTLLNPNPKAPNPNLADSPLH